MDLFDRRIYVGIVGSRRRDTDDDYLRTMSGYVSTTLVFGRWADDVTIISGGCKQGGDRFAVILAEAFRTRLVEHKPDRSAYPGMREPWRSTKQNYDRNALIARDSRDALIACVAPDRTGGTEDTIERWQRMHPTGVLVLV